MRKIFLPLLVSLFISMNISAQDKAVKPVIQSKQVLQIAKPDTSNQHLFTKHPELKSISVSYKENQPYIVFLNFKNDNNRREHYDLAFEGDAFVLKQKYGSIHFIDPKQVIQSIWTNTDAEMMLVGTTISKDTIYYRGRELLLAKGTKKYDPDWKVGMPARYNGDLDLLGDNLAKDFAVIENAADIDSISVFRGSINKSGNLYDMELIAGKQSVFSDLVQKELMPPKDELGLLPPRADWYPAVIDRGPIETKVRIYARLNPDGSIMIKTPRILRTFTGE